MASLQRTSPTKGESTRRFLLQVAGEVFATQGYSATRFSDLIDASGLTKGAFYFHFASKADLAAAVLEDQEQRWLDHVRERVLVHEDPGAQFDEIIPALLDKFEADPGAWSVSRLARELATDSDLAGRAIKPMQTWVDFVADIIRRAQHHKAIRIDVDPDTAAAALVGAFDGIKTLTETLEPQGAKAADPSRMDGRGREPDARAAAFRTRVELFAFLAGGALRNG